MKFSNPWPSGKRVTSPYGVRKDPFTGSPRKHRGVDVSGSFPVIACGDGIVHGKGFNRSGGGNWFRIDHGSGIYSVYYHGAQAAKQNRGDRIAKGDLIYTSGSTGRSTGNHLHFEIRRGGNGQWGFDVDPMPYLSNSGDGPGSSTLIVNGRLDRPTIQKWQEILKREGYDPGLVDGRMGPRTISAIQKSVNVRQDGKMGSVTITAIQQKLGSGLKKDGIMGRFTISAIQRKLNTGRWSK